MFDYSSVPVGYYDRIFHRASGIQSKWHHMKFGLFAERLPGCVRHLDIASGPGTFIGALPSGCRSVGVDIAAPQIAYATATYGSDTKSFVHIKGFPYPFAGGSFDVVTVIELLEHLSPEEGRAVLAEAYRLLLPGGKIFVSTPNYSSLWPFVENIVNRLAEVSYEHQHITKYTAATLHAMIDGAGFRNIEAEAYQGFSFVAAALHWRLPDLLYRVEKHITLSRYGLLLFGAGTKPLSP